MQAHALHAPSRQENGASRPSSRSTSSNLLRCGQVMVRASPSNSTSTVLDGPEPSSSTGCSSNGLPVNELNRSTMTRSPGTPSPSSTFPTRSMNGSGPQRKARRSARGAISARNHDSLGTPCTDSSQWTTVSRSPNSLARVANSSAKMIESSSRLAYNRVTEPLPERRQDFRIDMTGMMPLPPATNNRSSSNEFGVKVPAGRSTSRTLPSTTWSQIQFDAYPPAVRLTVTFGFSPHCGELHNE